MIETNYPFHEHASSNSALPGLVTCTRNFTGRTCFPAMRYNYRLADKIWPKFQGDRYKKAIHIDVECPHAACAWLLDDRNGARCLDALVAALAQN